MFSAWQHFFDKARDSPVPNCQSSPEPPAALQMGTDADFAVTHDCLCVAAGPPLTKSCQGSLPLAISVMPTCATGESSCCHHSGHAVGGCPPTQLLGDCRADKLQAAPASQVRSGCVACMLTLALSSALRSSHWAMCWQAVHTAKQEVPSDHAGSCAAAPKPSCVLSAGSSLDFVT